MRKALSLFIVLSGLLLLIEACDQSPLPPKIERFHTKAILLDHFGMEVCLKPERVDENAIFSYFYEIYDTANTHQLIANRILERDSSYVIDSLRKDLVVARLYYRETIDSLDFEEYRIRHSGQRKKITVLYRYVDTEEDFKIYEDLEVELDECHDQPL